MDKVVGWAFLEGRLPLADAILCVSGRLSFELVQKAAVAGCPVLVAVGAPSSLAVELGRNRSLTLCGFVRGGRMNVYTETWRVSLFLPVDVPLTTPELIRTLEEACDEAAITTSGPLPAAVRRDALRVLERRLQENELRLRDAFDELSTRVVETGPDELVNINQPKDLEALARHSL
jgi:FdhD/NarQ family